MVCLSLLRIVVSELVETGIDIIFKTRSRANKNPYPNVTHVFTQTACHCIVVAFYVMWCFPIWLVNREENKYRNVITVFQMSTVFDRLVLICHRLNSCRVGPEKWYTYCSPYLGAGDTQGQFTAFIHLN